MHKHWGFINYFFLKNQYCKRYFSFGGALVFQEDATKLFSTACDWLTTNRDGLFMLTPNLVFLFCQFVAVSPLCKVRLGWQPVSGLDSLTNSVNRVKTTACWCAL